MSSGGIPLLNGRVSRELKATVVAKGEAAHLSAIKLVSDFFTVRCELKHSNNPLHRYFLRGKVDLS